MKIEDAAVTIEVKIHRISMQRVRKVRYYFGYDNFNNVSSFVLESIMTLSPETFLINSFTLFVLLSM